MFKVKGYISGTKKEFLTNDKHTADTFASFLEGGVVETTWRRADKVIIGLSMLALLVSWMLS